ncbi:MAG: type IV secretory system conjugative DNA transfer family protein [Acidimicrobiales bacterium]
MEGPPARLYVGAGDDGPLWAPPEHAVLVLGPPRSGKTSSLVVPTVLGTPGPVVTTSTKPDVLTVTAPWRSGQGRCRLFDPSGTVELPPGVEPLRWSPVPACARWDDALLVARAVVGATRVPSAARDGTVSDHWTERAEALLAPLLHAAALSDVELPGVLSWVDRHQGTEALRVLDERGAGVAGDLLAGIIATESREQSGIWSTASGVLAAYRSDAALATTRAPDFDASAFCGSGETLYVCATGRHQQLAAPLVVGLLTEIRAAAYARAAGDGPGRRNEPVVLALDEVANIAPLPDLPAMVSEGGGQGLLTMACLQDLSQARVRWGEAADGFLSLFGTTIVLGGIGDVRTLESLSALGGDEEVATTSLSAPLGAPAGVGARLYGRAMSAVGGMAWRGGGMEPRPSVTVSSRQQRRLPVDELARGRHGEALVVDDRNRMGWARLTPWFRTEPWRNMVLDAGRRGPTGRHHERERFRGPELGR